MKLYFFPVAPNPTRVRLYLAEKEEAGASLDVEEVVVDLSKGEHRGEAHLARNPLGKLPVLELDDGSYLTESLAIIEYLEECYPEPSLIGTSPRARAQVRELERLAELSVLVPIARAVHATNSPLGLPAKPQVAEGALEALQTGLSVVDHRLAGGRPWLAGTSVTIADSTLAAALQFARFGKIEIDPAFEHLARWDEAYRARSASTRVLLL